MREDAPPLPLTDYSRFKLACERDLLAHPAVNGMERIIIRPATVCGYAPRMRLDLAVNILTIHALVNHKIRIFGGKQLRPNLHIADMVRAYLLFLAAPAPKPTGKPSMSAFKTVPSKTSPSWCATLCKDPSIALEYIPTDDNRSYHVNSDKVKRVLGFEPKFTIQDAIQSIADAYRTGFQMTAE